MNVKNYRGKSVEECMKKLKAEMGRDAVILQSRTIHPLFGRFGRPIHEIVAASEVSTVLDKLSAKAAERDGTAAQSAPAQEPEEAPRLTLSSGTVPAATSGRERLTLAQAAALREQGDFERLAAAGLIRDEYIGSNLAVAQAPAAAPRPAISPAPAQPAPIKPEDDRIARLEKQIAMLTEAMEAKRAVPQPAAIAPRAAQASPTPAPAERLTPTVIKAAPVNSSTQTPSVAPVKEPTQPGLGLGGFLRYRVGTQKPPVEKKASKAVETIAEIATASASNKLLYDPYEPLMNTLRSAHVAEALIRRLREEAPEAANNDEAKSNLHDLIAKRMLIGGAISPTPGKVTLAALLGPTGVGKTTTIAKLAANLSLSSGVSVGMVTLDTQRIAAVQQLQAYGEALNLPVKVAYDKVELERILLEYALEKVEIVLIDTPGRGPSESLSLAEMSASLRSIINLHSFLVLPATLSGSNFEQTIVRFTKIAKPNAIILTKMDETADNHCLGFLLNAQAKHQLPLSYVTMGARVPDDLLTADAHIMVRKLLTTQVMS